MSLGFYINEITFNNGNTFSIERDDIVVFVGPNNSGKSASIREINNLLQDNLRTNTIIVKKINIIREGEKDEIINLIETNSLIDKFNYIKGLSYDIYKPSLENYINNFNKGLGTATNFFANNLNTESRIISSNPAKNIRVTQEQVQNPIHFLQKDDNLEKILNTYFNQAFGTDLILHRLAGSEVPFYVGKTPDFEEGEDRASRSYLEKLEKLDLLHEQGDGMRSFVGVILNSFVPYFRILFIDEPEAFLHPPQARLLGKMLAKELSDNKQIFLSTHSEDFLKGLLETNSKRLKILRIERNGDINNISILNSSDIEVVWKDSILRHSNILSGLFHSKVILCESDSDCRLFSAILSSIYEDSGNIVPDILFTHCGGKHRMPVVVKALRKLNVPVTVVADFDILNNVNPLKDLYIDLGGNWDDVENDWKLVKDEIDRKRPELQSKDLKEEIQKIFDSNSERIFPKEKIKLIENTLKKASAWSEAKKVGKSFIPNGNPSQAFERIQQKFKSLGLFILEVGEAESFVKTVGNHGPKYVNEVLEKDLKTDPELELLRNFVKEII
jgi:energy-coupling factor transporter ATP-binding protein EcfA2